jgi:RNA polymerase sigma-70 factor (ECF subfamily)
LLKQHSNALKKAALKRCRSKSEADDLMGDVLLYATNHAQKFAAHPAPLGWLITVMHHRYIDRCRTAKPTSMEAWLQIPIEEPAFERFHAHETLRLATQALDARLAKVIQLRLDGQTYQQIGEEIGVSVAEAARLVGRAQHELRAFIERD